MTVRELLNEVVLDGLVRFCFYDYEKERLVVIDEIGPYLDFAVNYLYASDGYLVVEL